MEINYLQLGMEIAGVVTLSIFGFYAVKLLGSFRKGMLERGWRLVTLAAIILVLAQIPFLVAAISSSSLAALLTDIGNVARFVGIVCLTIGFRAQYQIWRIDKKQATHNWGSGNTIEP
jgi:hypothetical protein